MSWYLLNRSMLFDYPTSGGGAGCGGALGFIAGWFYLVSPFAVLSALFLLGRAIIRWGGSISAKHPRKNP